MSDDREYFDHSATNTYDTKLKARSFSYDNKASSEASDTVKAAASETSSAAAAGTAGAGAGIGAGIATTSVVGAVVTATVLVVAPSVSNTPKLEAVEATVSARTLSYSFNVTYISVGSLEVRLENIDDARSATYELKGATKDSAPSPRRNEAGASSGDSSGSESSADGSSASAAAQYTDGISGLFDNLLANRSYSFIITTPLNEDIKRTLYSSVITTSAAPILTVGDPSIDYDDSKLNVPVNVSDPSGEWKEGSLFAVIKGRCMAIDDPGGGTAPAFGTDGDVITLGTDYPTLARTAHLTPPYANGTQTFDLTKFLKGYLIRFQIYGGAETNYQMLYETGLYY
jgi:hypothetical protein